MTTEYAKLIEDTNEWIARPFDPVNDLEMFNMTEDGQKIMRRLLEALAGGSRAEATEAQVEAAARVIAPGSWRVMDGYLVDMLRKHNRGDAGYDPAAFKDKESMAIARRVLNEAFTSRDHQLAELETANRILQIMADERGADLAERDRQSSILAKGLGNG